MWKTRSYSKKLPFFRSRKSPWKLTKFGKLEPAEFAGKTLARIVLKNCPINYNVKKVMMASMLTKKLTI